MSTTAFVFFITPASMGTLGSLPALLERLNNLVTCAHSTVVALSTRLSLPSPLPADAQNLAGPRSQLLCCHVDSSHRMPISCLCAHEPRCELVGRSVDPACVSSELPRSNQFFYEQAPSVVQLEERVGSAISAARASKFMVLVRPAADMEDLDPWLRENDVQVQEENQLISHASSLNPSLNPALLWRVEKEVEAWESIPTTCSPHMRAVIARLKNVPEQQVTSIIASLGGVPAAAVKPIKTLVELLLLAGSCEASLTNAPATGPTPQALPGLIGDRKEAGAEEADAMGSRDGICCAGLAEGARWLCQQLSVLLSPQQAACTTLAMMKQLVLAAASVPVPGGGHGCPDLQAHLAGEGGSIAVGQQGGAPALSWPRLLEAARERGKELPGVGERGRRGPPAAESPGGQRRVAAALAALRRVAAAQRGNEALALPPALRGAEYDAVVGQADRERALRRCVTLPDTDSLLGLADQEREQRERSAVEVAAAQRDIRRRRTRYRSAPNKRDPKQVLRGLIEGGMRAIAQGGVGAEAGPGKEEDGADRQQGDARALPRRHVSSRRECSLEREQGEAGSQEFSSRRDRVESEAGRGRGATLSRPHPGHGEGAGEDMERWRGEDSRAGSRGRIDDLERDGDRQRTRDRGGEHERMRMHGSHGSENRYKGREEAKGKGRREKESSRDLEKTERGRGERERGQPDIESADSQQRVSPEKRARAEKEKRGRSPSLEGRRGERSKSRRVREKSVMSSMDAADRGKEQEDTGTLEMRQLDQRGGHGRREDAREVDSSQRRFASTVRSNELRQRKLSAIFKLDSTELKGADVTSNQVPGESRRRRERSVVSETGRT